MGRFLIHPNRLVRLVVVLWRFETRNIDPLASTPNKWTTIGGELPLVRLKSCTGRESVFSE